MPIDNPFEIHPPLCPVETCACCNGTMLLADTPAFEDEPSPATLALPSEAMLYEAMDIVQKLHARGGEGSREELLIARLLDAYILNAELLTRCVIHGRNGGETGDEEYDAEKLEEALDIAHDVVRVGLRTANAPPSVPESILLDIGNWLTDVGLDRDSLEERERDEDDAEHDATATVVCDIEDCPIHAPTPTTFEA